MKFEFWCFWIQSPLWLKNYLNWMIWSGIKWTACACCMLLKKFTWWLQICIGSASIRPIWSSTLSFANGWQKGVWFSVLINSKYILDKIRQENIVIKVEVVLAWHLTSWIHSKGLKSCKNYLLLLKVYFYKDTSRSASWEILTKIQSLSLLYVVVLCNTRSGH